MTICLYSLAKEGSPSGASTTTGDFFVNGTQHPANHGREMRRLRTDRMVLKDSIDPPFGMGSLSGSFTKADRPQAATGAQNEGVEGGANPRRTRQ
jgi:hypothetical protein